MHCQVHEHIGLKGFGGHDLVGKIIFALRTFGHRNLPCVRKIDDSNISMFITMDFAHIM